MSVALDDLPALMWHAELGRSLPDLWSGSRHRGAQLHDLRAAVTVWATRYGQRAWLRQLEPPPAREMEDAVLRTIARLDGTPFPSAARLASGWLRGRLPPVSRGAREAALETAYCAEIVAVTYQAMGLLPARRPNWYDAGRFWSGDDLRLSDGPGSAGDRRADPCGVITACPPSPRGCSGVLPGNTETFGAAGRRSLDDLAGQQARARPGGVSLGDSTPRSPGRAPALTRGKDSRAPPRCRAGTRP